MQRSVPVFVEQLLLDGLVRIEDDQPATKEDVHDAARWVMQQEPSLRDDLAYAPPVVEIDSLAWAVRQAYAAAQLAVFRQLGPDEIPLRISDAGPSESVTASMVYSVDLVFRFLPDLVRIVKAMNPDDPLLSRLLEWSTQWPLSSVGIPDVSAFAIEPILQDRCLSMMYADRIIRAEATDRLHDPRVRELVAGMIGPFPELSPKLHSVITNDTLDP